MPQPDQPSTPRDPSTSAEWQEAVNTAELVLLIDSARQYGLIRGGPRCNQQRCTELLERGAALGYTPAPINELLAAMQSEPEVRHAG